MEAKSCNTSDIAWAKRKIMFSWTLTGIGTIMFVLSFLAGTVGKESIFKIIPILCVGTPFMAYAAWSAYWVFIGAFWPFVRRHWKGLLFFTAINLPAFGLIGIFLTIVLLPIAFILLVMASVIGAAVALLGSLAIILYGMCGGGIYHYVQTRKIAQLAVSTTSAAAPTISSLSATPPPLLPSPWFGLVDGEQVGPYSFEDLQAEVGQRWSNGAREVLIAQAGDEDWRKFPESLKS